MLPTTKTVKEDNYLKYTYLWYGKPKIGKTTTAANFGDDNNHILFFTTEPGHKFTEIFKWQDDLGNDPTSWLDFKTCCDELISTQHSFKCLAIDTLDILWRWCSDFVCEKYNVEHESDGSYGKLYSLIKLEFMNTVGDLAQRGMGFIFMSHEKKMEEDVEIPDKENPEIMLSTKATVIDNTLSNGAKLFVKGFCDYIWYFGETPQGERYVLTQSRNFITAGSRGDLTCKPIPVRIKMNAENIKKALELTKEKIDV